MAARLSVNINKIATLRNSRGGNVPDVLQAAVHCQAFGADGITVHPRPDERHIRYADVRALRPLVTTEFNIEGNPKEESFVQLVLEVKPEQVTLVPDERGQLTSNHGWDTIAEADYLRGIIEVFKNAGIRTSIFVDPVLDMIAAAEATGTDRVELYTEAYAQGFLGNREQAIRPYAEAAALAYKEGLGINAGHDLSLENLGFFTRHLPALDEVSIGHALISDALYLGLENAIQMYKRHLTSL
jgi:pyridoxine 5-phosphate synthase